MTRRAIQIVDLGFGDSGKGTMVDHLARREEADLVVRYNGGPQAGHNVVLPDGRHHTFAQFGSAMFLSGVRTLLSRFMLVEPYAMLNEAEHLQSIGVADAMARTLIDGRCLVISPPQQIANGIRERARGAGAHGTCGMGVGECMHDSLEHPGLTLHAADLPDAPAVRTKLRAILEHKRTSLATLLVDHALPEERQLLDDDRWIDVAVGVYAAVAKQSKVISSAAAAETLRNARCAIFEGAQGVLLDERYGFHPHTTWSTTTFANADALLDEAGSDATHRRIGVIRTYMTRHGAGPMATEDPELSTELPEPHNGSAGWQGKFRCGVLDLPALRYALRVTNGVDALAVTHVDRLPLLPEHICTGYRVDSELVPDLGDDPVTLVSRAQPHWTHASTHRPAAWLAKVAEQLQARIGYVSFGNTHLEKQVTG